MQLLKFLLALKMAVTPLCMCTGALQIYLLPAGERIQNKIEIYSGHSSKPLCIKIIWHQIQI